MKGAEHKRGYDEFDAVRDASRFPCLNQACPPTSQNEGKRLANGVPDDGVQADAIRREEMAGLERH